MFETTSAAEISWETTEAANAARVMDLNNILNAASEERDGNLIEWSFQSDRIWMWAVCNSSVEETMAFIEKLMAQKKKSVKRNLFPGYYEFIDIHFQIVLSI